MRPYELGTVVKVSAKNDNENYDHFRHQELLIVGISQSTKDHPGYDESVGQPLYDLTTKAGESIDSSLYHYELTKVKKK